MSISESNSTWNRRRFLKTAGTIAAVAGVDNHAFGDDGPNTVALVIDPSDTIASATPIARAADQLSRALAAHGMKLMQAHDAGQTSGSALTILAAGAQAPAAAKILSAANITVAAAPEALALVSVEGSGRRTILACGHDTRGLAYALLELADIAANSANPVSALAAVETKAERPANQVRSMTRLFTSDVEDKPWYNDQDMWPKYFDLLAAQRFNRFNLAFGIGYDFIRNVTDAYFLFTYPFLLSVPGYNVRAPQLPDAERESNLEMLKFISDEAVARGLEFHVGLWMHGYVWINSPKPNYTIEGLNRDNHGPYCRDAVHMLLKSVPNISGLTFRIHGESGVEEGSYDFWKTVFDGVATCGRTVKLDMHPKGMDQTMIDIALATKQPVSMSPKYWAEHMGMPYHQADIRALEQPKPGDEKKTGLMKLSSGTRSFLRYGYGDLLREDRPWMLVHRIWPGTQRLLIWGDPIFAAGYSRAFSFCGSNGVEICEPLSFKGRRGSGIAGDRCAYLDATLKPRWDWQKYEYGTRVWGRLLYNPDTQPQTWNRSLTTQFGPGGAFFETALANVSRILPIITTGHATSAGNNTYWPEIYLNQSMVDAEHYMPYNDTPVPRVFGNVSPLDPELFSTINDHAEDLVHGRPNAKYTPIEVAQWIEDYAKAGRSSLAKAEASATSKKDAAYRRLRIDILLQAGLGEFFAAKFRSGVLFHIYEVTSDRAALEASLAQYRKARGTWAELANLAKDVYRPDITVGGEPQLRGHWMDRLPSIDKDIAAVSDRLKAAPAGTSPKNATAAIQKALEHPQRAVVKARHQPPAFFKRGQPVEIAIACEGSPAEVLLRFRHVDQAERYEHLQMTAAAGSYTATVPAAYTNSAYPLEYFFEVKTGATQVSLYPGFNPELNNQPYFVVRQG